MLDKIVDIINSSISKNIENNILFCKYKVEDKEFICKLFNDGLIENSNYDEYSIGELIVLEFSLPRISTVGLFETRDSFLKKYYYKTPIPEKDIYLYREGVYLYEDLPFCKNHELIVKLISELSLISKHIYEDAEISNVIILREDISLFLPFKYTYLDLKSLDNSTVIKIEQFIKLLKSEAFADKKNIYLNFFIEYLISKEENSRFSFLVQNFDDYDDKAQSSYNFYLRNFSYNKLKVELDSKALEFNQKLQTVINDSQTKLIAIPTALVFVFSTFDYENINFLKNYLLIIGLLIFCVFIQLFINNQKSSINFINDNISQYKSTFKKNNINELEESFSKVEKEKKKQYKRLFIIQYLLWSTPIITLSLVLFLNAYKLYSIILILLYIIIFLFIFIKTNTIIRI